jgi:hypothetical protein
MKNKTYNKIDEKYVYIIDYHYTREVTKVTTMIVSTYLFEKKYPDILTFISCFNFQTCHSDLF